MVSDMMILIQSPISINTDKDGREFMAVTDVAEMNKWSFKRPRKIDVADFFLNFGDIIWKGRAITVELELHKMLVRQWMRETGKTYAEIMDEMFEMSDFGEDPPRMLDNLQPNSKL